ncbi:MAG: acyltransferase family protein [Clostridia bacterium]|nr:acyltransferase family protein [Clostridia bacterium]
MTATSKERNGSVDCLRGIAILLVVLGHTISGSSTDYESSFLFNAIWSLQMPLFMLISGYVNKYRRPIDSGRTIGAFALKSTVAYLLPFFVWTFLVRGIMLRQSGFLDVKYLIWHMDAGYWFLFSLWTLTLIFGFSLFISLFFRNSKKIVGFFVTALVFGTMVAALLVVGKTVGLSFLGIKFTVYYSLFYFAGYTYGLFQEDVWNRRQLKQIAHVFVAICWGVWISLLMRYSIYLLPDGGISIVRRVAASLTGGGAICGTVSSIPKENKIRRALSYFGVHSLEIYLIHFAFLKIVTAETIPNLSSLYGVGLIVVNFILAVLGSVVLFSLLNTNSVTKFVGFGKVDPLKRIIVSNSCSDE